ncbi:sensor histidine kinase [Azospirillum sp. sgz301742]
MTAIPDSFASDGGEMPRAVVVQAMAVTAASILLLVLAVWASFDQAVQERNARAAVSARMVERALTQTLESVETTLTSIAEDSLSGLRDGDVNVAIARNRIRGALRFAPHLRQIIVLQGSTVLADSNEAGGESLDLERIGLFVKKDGGLSQGLRIGIRLEGRFLPARNAPPVAAAGAVGGRSFVTVGVTVGGPEGSDPITLIAALNSAHLESFFTDVGLGAGGAYALARLDGVPLIGTPGAQGWAGLLGTVVESGADERFSGEGPRWWPDSATNVRLSSRYPMAVILRVSHRDTLQGWAESNEVMLLVLIAATATVAVAVGVLLRGTIRRTRLQGQVRLLFHAIEQSPTAVLITNAAGSIRYVNPAFTALLGYAPDEVAGQNPRMLKSDRTPSETYTELWATIGAGKAWRGEFLNKTKAGAVVNVSSTVSAMRDAAGATTHFVGMMADITEAKRVEMERESLLMQLDRAHGDLQRFAEVSAHHLQEPARRLVSFAKRLQARLAGQPDDGDVAFSLTVIADQAGRMRDLLRDIQLYLAADQPLGAARLTDVAGVLRAVLERMADRIGETGAEVTLGDLPPVVADPPRLQEVFAIVIGNAVRHWLGERPLTIHVTGERTEDRVRYRVADNGPGIPEQYRDRVFRVFERLHATPGDGGTGIGLAIVRRIVESAGGVATIEETPGGGTTVVLDLPAEQCARPGPVAGS